MTICFARNVDNELQYLTAIRLTKRTAHAFAPLPKANLSSASIAAQESKRNDRKERTMKSLGKTGADSRDTGERGGQGSRLSAWAVEHIGCVILADG